MVLAPLVVWFLVQHTIWSAVFALVLFSVAAITDTYDGYLARRFNATSTIGIFLDPLADKVLVFSLLGYYWWQGYVPTLPLVIMLMRDVGTTVQRLHRGVTANPMPASWLGKIKTILQMTFVYVLMVVDLATTFAAQPLIPVFTVFAWLVAAVALAGAWRYGLSLNLAIVSLFGLGYSPILPGTVGSLVALLFWWALPALSGLAIILITATLFMLGLFIGAPTTESRDPSYIIIDEVVGIFLVLMGLPHTGLIAMVALVSFRFFDMVKPWPIPYVERLPGSLGIMLDDVVAALMARGVIELMQRAGWI